MIRNRFEAVVSALVYSLIAERPFFHADRAGVSLQNQAVRFVLGQHRRMPDFLRFPFVVLTLLFDWEGFFFGGAVFHRQPPEVRRAQIFAWRESPLKVKRDFMRFYDSLSALVDAAPDAPAGEPAPFSIRSTRGGVTREEVLVIGSGPGGSVTACLLAEAGRGVTMLEEGPALSLRSCVPFSSQEMRQKYRNGGLTPALGKTAIAYAEGRCVGGGSEINSGLYHRTPEPVLDRWRREYGVEEIDSAAMLPFFEACERDVSVTTIPGGRAPAASMKLHEGARTMGWKSMEVPRWFKFDESSETSEMPTGTRQSMTQTFLPRALQAGLQLRPGHRAATLRHGQGRWRVEGTGANGEPFMLEAETVFVCAGATQTPALLRRSGITRQVGETLQMHPSLKAVAEFPDLVNREDMGVPVHQVKEFPDFSFGCSISTPPFLRLGLLDHPAWAGRAAEAWRHLAIYYAMIVPEGRGTVRTLPGFRDTLVRYRLTPGDRRRLGEAARKLCEVLLAAGASAVYPGIRRSRPITDRAGLSSLPNQLANGSPGLMTIHLFSSCPMGERRDRCAVDSFGRVHGLKNLHVADASLLCTAPGVNPQGTIMALARRNALHFLEKNR